ncbi:cytochrome P450 [Mycena pura]|uniref:Cytochrome P450 n=1 Tax=Mycena pura TaxID=153505 RepID=A0AAD7E5Q9_9AGAR|nr:cytochrome P450 [Mycena pura]
MAGSSLPWNFVALAVLVYCALRWKRNRTRLPLPPGPKKLPLVGNLFDMPPDRQWESYHRWSQEFDSDIIHLDVAGTSIVVLSSMEAARELFERRSSLYSDRRAHRKMIHEAFNVGAAKQFRPQERAAAHALLRRQFRLLAGGLIMDITYGIQVSTSDDPYIKMATEAMHGLAVATIPGAFLVDTIPLLKSVPSWVPGAGFKRQAQRWRKVTLDMLEMPFREVKRNTLAGTAPPSFASLSLRRLDESKGVDKQAQEVIIKGTAGSMYAAGADTTVSALGTFVLAMLANPEAQAKAQAELDAVIGPGNLPDFADEASLPYVSAIVKEVLRWKNVTPIGIPHYVAVEDEYAGYRIPAGSIVVGNTWSILHDQDMYPDPHSFKPERFLRDGTLNPAVRDPQTAAFGFGRRICPGMHMALGSMWITIASILATLHIGKAADEHGKVLEPSYEYFSGLVSAPLPFKCSITPRSAQAAEAIEATGGSEEQ